MTERAELSVKVLYRTTVILPDGVVRDMLFVVVQNDSGTAESLGRVPFVFKDSHCEHLTASCSAGRTDTWMEEQNGAFTVFVDCPDTVVDPSGIVVVGCSVSRPRLSVHEGEDTSFGDAIGKTPAARFDSAILTDTRRPTHFDLLPRQGGRCGHFAARWRGVPSPSERKQLTAKFRRMPEGYAHNGTKGPSEAEKRWFTQRLAISVLATGARNLSLDYSLLGETEGYDEEVSRLSDLPLDEVLAILDQAPDGMLLADAVSPPTSILKHECALLKKENHNTTKGSNSPITNESNNGLSQWAVVFIVLILAAVAVAWTGGTFEGSASPTGVEVQADGGQRSDPSP